MVQIYFRTFKTAKRIARRRNKGVYKISDGIFFVGTYEQAVRRIRIAKRKQRGK